MLYPLVFPTAHISLDTHVFLLCGKKLQETEGERLAVRAYLNESCANRKTLHFPLPKFRKNWMDKWVEEWMDGKKSINNSHF